MVLKGIAATGTLAAGVGTVAGRQETTESGNETTADATTEGTANAFATTQGGVEGGGGELVGTGTQEPETEAAADTGGGDAADEATTNNGGQPGFGVAGAVAGLLGGASYLRARRGEE